ncbi:MAG: manganese efflux pump [bacterium]|nr:manganese efflux pump [bacterium]
MNNLIYFFMAIGLSMDAFSLSIAYGTNYIKKSKILFLSTLVGLFHYIMPFLGSIIGGSLAIIIMKTNYIVSLVFLILAYEMYKSKDEEQKGAITNLLSLFIFAITVSLDSFSVGLALGLEKANLNSAFLIFAITSATFTFIGLLFGNHLSKKYGKKANYFGIIILTILAIKYLLS